MRLAAVRRALELVEAQARDADLRLRDPDRGGDACRVLVQRLVEVDRRRGDGVDARSSDLRELAVEPGGIAGAPSPGVAR